jgi:hypothetical protein
MRPHVPRDSPARWAFPILAFQRPHETQEQIEAYGLSGWAEAEEAYVSMRKVMTLAGLSKA